jgi:sugar/nucleoside kinase (ribokinase family)
MGIQTVLDGGSWKDGTDRLLETIDTAICSADFKPPACRTADDTIAYLEARGVKEIAITNGPEPIQFVSGSASGFIPVPQVHAVDTMGAGDILHGASCYYTAVGCAFEQALERAARIASESCCLHGTRQWMHRPL